MDGMIEQREKYGIIFILIRKKWYVNTLVVGIEVNENGKREGKWI